MSVALAACGASTDPGEGPEPTPTIEDGDWFAWVTNGEDESRAMTIGVDLAEMLTGRAAHDAAVQDGVINEDEDLPNDFHVDSPEIVYEPLHFADEPRSWCCLGTTRVHLYSSNPRSLESSMTARIRATGLRDSARRADRHERISARRGDHQGGNGVPAINQLTQSNQAGLVRL